MASAIEKVAENQIAAWLRDKGDKNLPHGKKLVQDVHKAPAQSLGLKNDYVHSKILADNNIRPESVQRRLDLDAAWNECAEEIRREFLKYDNRNVEDFVQSSAKNFQETMDMLNVMAKRVNDAIIEDSMRFGGRSPVPHARPFRLEERIREAIENKKK